MEPVAQTGKSDASGALSSDVGRVIAHQEQCTAKLQEQISVLSARQEQLHSLLEKRSGESWHPHALHAQRTAQFDHLLRGHSQLGHSRGSHIDHSHEQHGYNHITPREPGHLHALHVERAGTFDHHHEPHGYNHIAPRENNHRMLHGHHIYHSEHSQHSNGPHHHSQSSQHDNGLELPGVSQTAPSDLRLSHSVPDEVKRPSEEAAPSNSLAPPAQETPFAKLESATSDLETVKEGRFERAIKRPFSASVMPRESTASCHSTVSTKMRHIQMAHRKGITQQYTIATGLIMEEEQQSRFVKAIKSGWFDQLCAFMLISNSLLIGITVEYSASNKTIDLPSTLVVIDHIYGLWFIIELFLRIKASGLSFFTNLDDLSWNLFDCIVISMSTLEMLLSLIVSSGPLKTLSMVRTVRIARIARIARVIRLMRFFRSLRILLSAIFNTLKSCVWTAMLLGIILYMFGVVFVQAVTEYRIDIAPKEADKEMLDYYANLPRGIFTMFKSVLGGLDWEVAVQPLSDLHELYVVLFVLMITFIYLAVINVISGLFLQSAIESAQGDREDIIRQQLKEKDVYVQKALSLFSEFDDNMDGHITLSEFKDHLHDERIIGFLKALEIDPTDAWTLFTLLDFDQGGTVSVDEFIEGCLTIRGNAKSLHIAQIMYENKWLMDALDELTTFIDIQFQTVQEQIENSKVQQPPVVAPQPVKAIPPPKSVLGAISTPSMPANAQISKGQPDGHTPVTEMFTMAPKDQHLLNARTSNEADVTETDIE